MYFKSNSIPQKADLLHIVLQQCLNIHTYLFTLSKVQKLF